MSLTRKSPILVPLIQAATGAVEGATAGAIGGAVLNDNGYNFHTPSQAAAGALGGAILGGSNGLLEVAGLFKRSVPMKSRWTDRIVSPFSTIGFNAFAGLIGGALLKHAEETNWQLALLALTVGGALVYLPKLVASELSHASGFYINAEKNEGLLSEEVSYHRISPS